MRPLHSARVEDLGADDLVNFACTACRCSAWLSREFLSGKGVTPAAKVLDLQSRIPCSDCGVQGRAIVWVRWSKSAE